MVRTCYRAAGTLGTPRESTIALGALAPRAWNHAETPGATGMVRGRHQPEHVVQAP